jgi:hypothetical protein
VGALVLVRDAVGGISPVAPLDREQRVPRPALGDDALDLEVEIGEESVEALKPALHRLAAAPFA